MDRFWPAPSLVSISLCFCLAACGEDESDTDSVDSIDMPFIVAADVTPASVADFEAYELYEELQDADFLYNNKPSTSAAEDEASDVCIDEKFAQLKAKASGDTLSFGGRVDMTSCLNLDQEEGFKVAGAVFSFFFQLVCPDTDLSAFADKSFSDEVGSEIECLAGSTISNMAATFAITGTVGDTSFDVSSRMATYEGTSPREGCNYSQVDEVVTMEDGCKSVEVSETTRMLINGVESEAAGADITEFTSQGVTYRDNETDVWLASGTMNGRVNNWNGNIVFGEGSANPTYTFTSVAGETQDSTIAPATSPGLLMTQTLGANLRSFQRSIRQTHPVYRTIHAYYRYR